MIELVITIDYELFGNGSGDVRRDVIEPTNRLLAICDRYGAKLTLMFEVAEYWAFQEAERDGRLDLAYSPSREMERQAQDAVGRGHDVQLHLHPQWIGARYEDGLWHLHSERMRLIDLRDSADPSGSAAVEARLSRGKRTLEAMLQGVDPGYGCFAFRAGGFFVQPAAAVIAGLRNAGLWADSSVVCGHVASEPCPVDFRRAKGLPEFWWTTPDDVAECGGEEEGVLEFPVYSEMKPYVCNFKLSKVVATMRRRTVERRDPHSQVASAPQSVPSVHTVLGKLLSRHAVKFDICKLSARDMCAMFASAARRAAGADGAVHPLVALGHTKDFWNDTAFERFLQGLCADSRYRGQFRWNTLAGVTKQVLGARSRRGADGVEGPAAALPPMVQR
ncbi:hypothetical protein [Anaerobaca lacustris]|uniref:Polysaccharide deacetylase n=1 Tax=Anaerobaca lacustris TaxID=3044600 RepID=A0AAW6U0R0_9BACT|nr:hypothetical protein [Sedimentisphaerales bacterium M17dextr]